MCSDELVIGAIWYSPFSLKAWQKETGISDEQVAKASQSRLHADTIIGVDYSYNLAFSGDSKRIGMGLDAGLWPESAGQRRCLIIGLFEQRSWKHMLINCGYITIYFAVVGFVLGIWR